MIAHPARFWINHCICKTASRFLRSVFYLTFKLLVIRFFIFAKNAVNDGVDSGSWGSRYLELWSWGLLTQNLANCTWIQSMLYLFCFVFDAWIVHVYFTMKGLESLCPTCIQHRRLLLILYFRQNQSSFRILIFETMRCILLFIFSQLRLFSS